MSARTNALESLVAAQEAAKTYWYLSRKDYERLGKLLDSWTGPSGPVHSLLAGKLDRGLVCDADQLPPDIVTMNAQVEIRVGRDVERCALTYPDETDGKAGAISIASPLGSLLLGMVEGRSLRAQGADGAAFTIAVEKVQQQASAHEEARS